MLVLTNTGTFKPGQYAKVEYVEKAELAKAKTYDEGKEPLAHLPWAAINEVSKVQAYGHKKYKDFNNYRKGMEVSRNISCCLRHIRDYMDGSNADHESGLHPLGHAICRLAFILQNLRDGVAIDDRYSTTSKHPDRVGLVNMAPVKSSNPADGVLDKPCH